MKFAGIAAMAAVVTAVTGAAIPNVNAALAEVHQATNDVQGLLDGNGDAAKIVSSTYTIGGNYQSGDEMITNKDCRPREGRVRAEEAHYPEA